MLRGYRVLGVAGLVAALAITFFLGVYVTELANPKHSERYQSYQSSQREETKTATSVANVSQTIVHHTPCNEPKSETQSDLCAQWRAAKAAEKSADWTAWGVLASIAGISLLLWQIILTREAVEDTGRATEAMNDANEIARKVYNANVRPWLSLEAQMRNDHLLWTEEGEAGVFVEFTARNHGQSPATNVNYMVKVDIGDFGGDYEFDYDQFFQKCCEELIFATDSGSNGETVFPQSELIDYTGDIINFDMVERSFIRFAKNNTYTGIAQFSSIYPVVFVGIGYNSPYDTETRITAYLANVMQFQHGVGQTVLYRRDDYSINLMLHPKVKGCARLD